MQALQAMPAPIDGDLYWQASLGHLYTGPFQGYVYPPPLAQLLAPAHVLGYGLFTFLWTLSHFAALWYCARPWSWLILAGGILGALTGRVLPYDISAVMGYALNGNVQLYIAAACVAMFRHPGSMALPILTKMGPGIGVLWWVFRREWWPLLVSIAVTAVIFGVSLLLAPGLWSEWLVYTLANRDAPSPIPLVAVPFGIRVLMSVALLAWAAPRDHRWAVPIAAGWAIPALYESTVWGVWVGAIALLGPRESQPRVVMLRNLIRLQHPRVQGDLVPRPGGQAGAAGASVLVDLEPRREGVD